MSEPIDMECPELPPTRIRHMADKVNARGDVSALCFPTPRAINMKRETWVTDQKAVTCEKCLMLIRRRNTPGVVKCRT